MLTSRLRISVLLVVLTLLTPLSGNAETHTCVGNPPRQSEDPLAPPCVVFFDDENGGDTSPGVTESEIRVVVYNDLGVTGDFANPSGVSGDPALVRTIAAQMQHFNERYMKYNRTVHLYAFTKSGTQRDDAKEILSTFDPFAVVHLGTTHARDFIDEIAIAGRQVVGADVHLPRSFLKKHASLLWSFRPDQTTETALSASFICRKLYRDKDGEGGVARARLANDPLLKQLPRTFGFIRPASDGSPTSELATRLINALNNRCPREGKTKWFDTVDTYTGGLAGGNLSEASVLALKYKLGNITTVVCYCESAATRVTVQSAASAAGYHPEWYWDDASAVTTFADTPLAAAQANFGITSSWRGPATEQQYHYQTYLESQPDMVPDVRWSPWIYHSFLMLWRGIQGSGPLLNNESFPRGIQTFEYQNRGNPYVPLGALGDAKSAQTFLDSAMGWSWDRFGTPPGGRRDEGCIRVMDQGLRWYAGEWKLGDAAIMKEADPCTRLTMPLHSS